jgi:uncharacterized membrane protein
MAFTCSGCGMYGFGGMWFFGAITWILVILALIVFIVWMLKQVKKK